MAATLQDAARLTDGELHKVHAPLPIPAIRHDSRTVHPGDLFACVRGENVDGHSFAGQVLEQGAAGLVVDHVLDLDAPQLVVADVRACLGPIADLVHGHPSQSMTTIGVTGTSGKTTVVYLLESVLSELGLRTASIGTLTGARTTPEAPELQALLADMVQNGIEAVAMEVSSHALALGRVAATSFDVAIFTNLGHDHLDFHGTIEAYRAAKTELFTRRYTKVSVLNRDTEMGRDLARISDTDVVTYGLADAVDLRQSGAMSEFEWRGCAVELRLAGEHNVANALAVATAVEALGYEPNAIAQALSLAVAPPGRFEVLSTEDEFLVAVDYAHKPEALAASLQAAHQVAGSGRVLVVFGCGGDRDREKRPLMGQVAAAGADVVIVTTDNPRTESPQIIIDAIVAAVPGSTELLVEPDRAKAIERALGLARAGDLVLIAGKGHETYQEINGEKLDFDDRVIALEILGGANR